MTGEIAIAGVLVHPLLIAAVLAFAAAELAGWALGRLGLYRFVWHRGLFDVALTVILWAGLAAILTHTPLPTAFGLSS
ncbi:DUF1656 domain-containing protein [Sphingomonas carotinifaciens]|uniref:DUF1656 domain-containing protein n=1 Tax=Sphingomonas carotinifaciens TaxID=1166323 RepID=A0A1G7HYR8_9SPHN|nr:MULTISPECIES: DUF1656 domain-containing protein [Sphingomonas]MBB4085068.1 hypothetical protein [Sphingomonas carotinifaciens]MWC44447.1 DUF1656 domain-containing protein [Sphingomonas carotinifaciens]SDF05622.1 Protein of unknown function [Sphingomonas carotinifaciens]